MNYALASFITKHYMNLFLMLDIKRIIENRTEVEANLLKRGKSFDLKVLLDLDESRKKIILETEDKKRIRNEASKKIGLLKSKGENPEEIMEEMRLLGDEISVLDKELKLVEENIKGELSVLPNLTIIISYSGTIITNCPCIPHI